MLSVRKLFTIQNWPYLLPNIILLMLLLMLIFVVPFFPPSSFAVLYHVGFTLLILASVVSLLKARKLNLFIALTVISIKWIVILYDSEMRTISNIPQLLFFTYIVGRILLQIATERHSTMHMILDCLNGYFLSVLVSALLIGLTAFLLPGSFNFPNVAETPVQGMNEYIYHAIVVFSTTGFGDITPNTPQAKSISNLISVAGQLYVAVIITLLLGNRRSSPRERMGEY